MVGLVAVAECPVDLGLNRTIVDLEAYSKVAVLR